MLSTAPISNNTHDNSKTINDHNINNINDDNDNEHDNDDNNDDNNVNMAPAKRVLGGNTALSLAIAQDGLLS